MIRLRVTYPTWPPTPTTSATEIVNAEIERIHSASIEVGEVRFDIQKFVPHPGMNDSYYLPDD
jgi:hypothetical protein